MLDWLWLFFIISSLQPVLQRAMMTGQYDDQTLLMADVGRKALRQVKATVTGLLQKHMDPVRAEELAEILSQGVWTHDNALMAPELEQLGLPVKVGAPAEERRLMDLYP